jgi:hypothetical protein
LNQRSAARLQQLLALDSDLDRIHRVVWSTLRILWVVDAAGVFHFALEEQFNAGLGKFATRSPKPAPAPMHPTFTKIGHPALVACMPARIGGEIYLDIGYSPPRWVITNKSGRYGVNVGRTEAHLTAVVAMLDRFGLTMNPVFI